MKQGGVRSALQLEPGSRQGQGFAKALRVSSTASDCLKCCKRVKLINEVSDFSYGHNRAYQGKLEDHTVRQRILTCILLKDVGVALELFKVLHWLYVDNMGRSQYP
eukprot:scaffold550101_cov50-Prasinocladus_malaysianus.AAC.1